ncbi:uncharacterized protein LOC107864810 [Capsicum annuum]|uniref:uncharacterized protein LOC107864810 n=1 Tax=Capsicum annuum TaxID=4072 RepID=UPI001FB06534|nr:uncharacterized protein LOC107864810 [Capsicum annuum]
MLVEKCPIKLVESTDYKTKAYDKWVKVDKMGRCYILASMKNMLQHQYQSMTIAYDKLESLTEIFDEKNRAAKQTAMKSLLTTKMIEETSVREHVLKMMCLLNKLKILGAIIGKESQVEMAYRLYRIVFNSFA